MLTPAFGFEGWLLIVGIVLLTMALSSGFRHRLPISTAAIYLALGVALGPAGLGWIRIDVMAESWWLERATELAVVVSLFVGGLKLRLPFRAPQWAAAVRLAGPLMVTTIVGVALFGHFVLGFSGAQALLIGAVLAPTDPVLAGSVSVHAAADKNRMRYGLSGEAGLNDGMAFPFVALAMTWLERGSLGSWLVEWFALKVLWAVPAALALGFYFGKFSGRIAIHLRSQDRDDEAPSDFFALALIAVAYSAAVYAHTWGFLAAFAAGIGLRHAEVKVVKDTPHPRVDAEASRPSQFPSHPPAEDLNVAPRAEDALEMPAVAAGHLVGETISFGDTVERFLEVTLVVLLGAALVSYWDWSAVPLAVFCFVFLRPIATRYLLSGTDTSRVERWLMGWLGIRGIGSLYYLAYCVNHGLGARDAEPICRMVLTILSLGIALHGVTAQPLVSRYERSLRRLERRAAK